ncbi:unnamed protein product [Darwinula stevensoni]|uniref:Uncharacterized protein n=1 Tax=Darwinula stevensoni TaxID=69355 RepID=A0A7R8XE82_9CRUS|nr:unnamed protein product [Darwinula stevensoni]CAG0894210.1 unnamed protein product [Darwinula stevensoni]
MRNPVRFVSVFYEIQCNASTTTEITTDTTETSSSASDDTYPFVTGIELSTPDPTLCDSMGECKQNLIGDEGFLEPCVNTDGEVPAYQQCLWNILRYDAMDSIDIVLTTEDFGDFEDGSLLLGMGYGYKDDFPGATDETVLASFDSPVTENVIVKVPCNDAWVSVRILKKLINPFRISYFIFHDEEECDATSPTTDITSDTTEISSSSDTDSSVTGTTTDPWMTLCDSMGECKQDLTESTGFLEPCVNTEGLVPASQLCLWNIVGNDGIDTIEILLTPEDFGEFEDGSLLLRIGYGYKDDFPLEPEDTELARFDGPVTQNVTVKVKSEIAWVNMLVYMDPIDLFRISYIMKKEGTPNVTMEPEGLLDFFWDQLGEGDPLHLLDNLTETIEDQGGLTGDEIDELMDLLDLLFDDFLDSLDEYPSPPDRTKEFLANYSRTVEEMLVSFEGWLDLTQMSRTENFATLTSTFANYGMQLLEKLLLNMTELEFLRSTTVFTAEVRSGTKESLTGPVVFPSAGGDTYLTLPASFRDDVGGDHYSYVGALYNVRDLNDLLPGHQNLFGDDKVVNTKLLSFSMKVSGRGNLNDPVTLTFRNAQSPQSPMYKEIWRNLHDGEKPTFIPQSHQCVFWNFNGSGFWDTEGLREVSSDRDNTVCQSHHLTNFAVLMSTHDYVMGCAVSAISIHFTFLCVFTWMALEGWHLHSKLQMVQRRSFSLRFYLMVGYTVPVGVVAITVGVSFGTGIRYYGEGEFCWLSSPAYIWGFAAPVLLVVGANSILLIWVFSKVRKVGRVPNGMQKHQAESNSVSSAVRVFSLVCLLGCGWLLGVLQMEVSPVFAYSFVVVGCSQGIGIFIFYCFMVPDRREKLVRCLKIY